MNTRAQDPLAPLVSLPGVAEASEAARSALATVHRHPANRRGWPTTAAESVLRGARASAGVEGASVRLDADGDHDEVLSGALRVAGELTGESLDRAVSVWTRSPLQELAHLHLLAASGPGVDAASLGRPRPDRGVAERLQGLAELVTFYRDPAAHRSALDGFVSGDEEGVGSWILHCCRALEAGAREATSIADAAGT